MDTEHETLVFRRNFDATPSQLFAAYVDRKVREVWSAPSPTVEVIIDESDVRTGGHEVSRCGSKGDLKWTMKSAYHLVVSDRHISFTEELWERDQLLTVALITFDIQPSGAGTELKLTDQVTSFVGQGGISGHKEGYDQALDNLGKITYVA